jgi:RNA polymerase sigma factor (sigma-70 family)
VARIGSAVGGDDFDTEVAAVVRSLFPLALLLCRDRVEAEDVLAESVVRCLPRWQARRLDNPRAYLRRTMINEVRARHRRSRIAVVIPLFNRDIAHDASLDELATVEVRGSMTEALKLVPERQRIAVALRYLEDLPFAEVAELMGTSTGTAKSQVSRGLEQLRGLLPNDRMKEHRHG